MANGMASLMVGASGLKSAQTALNTTAHNLSNINTSGYTRQQIAFKDTQYVNYITDYNSPVNSTYGLGVSIHEVRRIRDTFIDKAYRNENSRLGFYEAQYKAVDEIEDQFGEMQGVTYQQSLNNLYDAINELSKEPSSTVKRSSLIQNASAFMTRSDAVYQGLKNYQQTLNTQVYNMVNTINDLGDKIYKLNKQIAKIEAAGVETANDLRDQRDAALDELSKYMSITYYEGQNGEVIVSAESVPFVTVTTVTEMSYRKTEGTELYIPTFPAFERDVYPEDELYRANTSDKGELKGLLLARGSIDVNYSDIPVKPSQEDAKYQIKQANGTTVFDSETYNKDYKLYQDKQDYYNKYIESSPILCAIAGIDKLVNGIVTAIDGVLCPTKEYTTTAALKDTNGVELIPETYEYNNISAAVLYDAAGNEIKGAPGAVVNGTVTYSYTSLNKLFSDKEATHIVEPNKFNYVILDMDKTDYGNDDNHTIGEGIFTRQNTEDFVNITDGSGGALLDADGNKIMIKNNVNANGQRSDYTLGNILVNPETSQEVGKIPMTDAQGKEDMAKGQALVDVWNADFASLDPESYAVGNFQTFYNNFVSEFSTIGKVLSNFVDHQETMVNGYDNQRLQSEGVSSDEELEKMIKYQQSYNAASRYINVVSEMLEHLITSLGRA